MSSINPVDKSRGETRSEGPKNPEYEKYKGMLEKALKVANEVDSSGVAGNDKKEEFNRRFTKIETGAILEQNISFQSHVGNIRELLEQISLLDEEKKRELSGFLQGVHLGGCLEGRMDPVWDFLAIPTLIDKEQPVITNVARVFRKVVDDLILIEKTTTKNDLIAIILHLRRFANKNGIILQAKEIKEFKKYIDSDSFSDKDKRSVSEEGLEEIFDDYVEGYIQGKLDEFNPLKDSRFEPEQAMKAVEALFPIMQKGLHVFANNKLFEIEENQPQKSELITTDGNIISYSAVTYFFTSKPVKGEDYQKKSIIKTVFGLLGVIKSVSNYEVILENGLRINKLQIEGVVTLI